MENIFKRLALMSVLMLSSCTHWLIDTQTRIQMENGTNREICNLSLVSETGQIKILVPDTLKNGDFSRSYEYELVGKFNFAVFSGDLRKDLGKHRIKGGMILVQIKEEEGEFTLRFK
jgi:hypothetical protein